MSLDTTNTEPMYLLGRLWAICESAILASKGHLLDPAIVSTLYAQPMTGWARLHRRFISARLSLSEAKRQQYDADIGAIMEMVSSAGFPDAVSAESGKAGLLVLGYHHQSHAMR
jgi:CRISPR-associated protein (Cas_Csd1)